MLDVDEALDDLVEDPVWAEDEIHGARVIACGRHSERGLIL
jgi:hypothetical protein